MQNAGNGGDYDFKVRKMKENKGELSPLQYKYRGSMTSDNKMASARDFGNQAAGIVAGRSHLSLGLAKFGFDTYQNRKLIIDNYYIQ